MQNIQDLKEKIFFESMNIIDNLDKISNVDELLSKQDLVDELANRISFLKLLEKNIEYFVTDHPAQSPENQHLSFVSGETEHYDKGNEVTEEEAIFNNELNEIDENEIFSTGSEEEEAVFNNQLNEIVENEFHENIVNFVEEVDEEKISEISQEQTSDHETLEEEAVFNNELNEIDENEISEEQRAVLSFVDEEKILADSTPDSDEDLNEDLFHHEVTEEEAIFNNQLNEMDDQEEEAIETESKKETDFAEVNDAKAPVTEIIPSIFDTETLEDEILIEENEEQFVASNVSIEQGEMATETSNVENILSEIKNDHSVEETKEESILAEVYDRRKIVEIDKPAAGETEKHPSDESFENLEEYHQEKKIKLSNIKGLKAVQSLFDDDPLEREFHNEKQPVVEKEDNGSILKSNIPTNFMEADKQKPEFKLDLNDRIAFSKMLFEGSQTDLNDTVFQLNQFKTLEEAKEYLSDLYYERKWNKVDEYAQRLWILVENKFL
ncbi:hypothetical protein [Chryseobacterium sediminis]|uniref:Uncharacterized protein n=1 Tax=Chryseobacterium sediminis TaxID=1679494 RepID=A0A5B2U5D0_9FLAO|nr:hypothetical protein [Chryseobacterium sediminis]KAA2221530.1 hypothetical protein FW780_14710 [Chryseobacterium sediminis]